MDQAFKPTDNTVVHQLLSHWTSLTQKFQGQSKSITKKRQKTYSSKRMARANKKLRIQERQGVPTRMEHQVWNESWSITASAQSPSNQGTLKELRGHPVSRGFRTQYRCDLGSSVPDFCYDIKKKPFISVPKLQNKVAITLHVTLVSWNSVE